MNRIGRSFAQVHRQPNAFIEPYLPGDLLFFRGRDVLSNAIAWRTRRWFQWPLYPLWSHVAICADVDVRGEAPQTWLFESTTLCDSPCLMKRELVSGVQCHWPMERVESYPGEVWRLRLSRPLRRSESGNLSEFLLSEVGKPYDEKRAAFLAASRWWWNNPALEPTPDARFCSELAAEALKVVGRIDPDHDSESLSPNALGMLVLHSGAVWSLGEKSQSRKVK